MPAFREGKVLEVTESRRGLVRARVEVDSGEIAAAAYPDVLGPLEVGDRVIVNTTGLDLDLGTGGEGFILWNLDRAPTGLGAGHIVKLRYTPLQTEVLAVEAPESEHHAELQEAADLAGTPVV